MNWPWPWKQNVDPRIAKIRDAIDAVVSGRIGVYNNEHGAYAAYETAVLALAAILDAKVNAVDKEPEA